jgi:site-specific DNA-methyltransferase (adenine-specific)
MPATRTNSLLQIFSSFGPSVISGDVFRGEALEFLAHCPAESASIVFLDPPFNIGKPYVAENPRHDLMPRSDYWKFLLAILNESVRILKPGGALYIYHLPEWAMRIGAHLDSSLDFRHWIAISMKNGFARGDRLYPAHYGLLYFTKGKPGTFHRPRLRPMKCRHCGGLVKDYGGYRTIIESQGINLSDVWDDLSPVRHSKYKARALNELPQLLMDRVLAISGRAGDLYVDPFAGGGSGVLAAAKIGMTFLACDLVAENCELISKRVADLSPLLTLEDDDASNCECAAD